MPPPPRRIVASPGRDTTLVPFAAGPANETAGDASPDGDWIAYASDESGADQVYIRPFPGPGARIQVSDSGGTAPVWAADGRRVFYMSGRTLMPADLVRGPTSGSLRVAGRPRVLQGDFLGLGRTQRMYDVSPDGRRFLVARGVGETRSRLEVWVDWFDRLKARLAGGEIPERRAAQKARHPRGSARRGGGRGSRASMTASESGRSRHSPSPTGSLLVLRHIHSGWSESRRA